MDRLIEYPSEILFETELLGMQRNAMVALASLTAAVIGSNTAIDGLLVGVASPAALQVVVASGSIFQLASLDATPYSSLAADVTHQIVKNGINLDPTSLVITPPSTAGQSINYLIQAAILEADTQSVTLNYYNSANPTQPFSGVNGNGVPQATLRKCSVSLTAKAGVAAATGSQVTPAPDAGFVGLAVVTVANGQGSITAGNITNLTTAPRLNFKLGNVGFNRIRLSAALTIYVATTGSDANDGLSAGTAVATINKALSIAANNYELNGQTVTIQCADGTYTTGASLSLPFIGGNVTLQGNVGTPANCIIAPTSGNCITVSGGSVQLNVKGFKLVAAAGSGLYATFGGQINVTGAMNYGACSGLHNYALTLSKINITSNYTISGGAQYHWAGEATGIIVAASITVTLSGTPAFSSAFALARSGNLQIQGNTFSGSATGVRWLADTNGIIQTNTGTPNTYIPGNAAGTQSSGGQAV